jgi:hypothetical protein
MMSALAAASEIDAVTCHREFSGAFAAAVRAVARVVGFVSKPNAR